MPGTYDLNCSVIAPPLRHPCGSGDSVANDHTKITVSPLAQGKVYDPEPMDLGTLTLSMIKQPLKVGDMLPDFNVPLLLERFPSFPRRRESCLDIG